MSPTAQNTLRQEQICSVHSGHSPATNVRDNWAKVIANGPGGGVSNLLRTLRNAPAAGKETDQAVGTPDPQLQIEDWPTIECLACGG